VAWFYTATLAWFCSAVDSGGPGAGKSLLAAEFLARGSRQFGEPGVLVTFDETSRDVIANVASLGFDLEDLITQKKLIIIDPSSLVETGDFGLEGLFIRLGRAIDEVGAKRIVLDSIESLFAVPNNQSVMRPELRRLFTWLKEKGVTAMVTGERGKGGSTIQGLEEYISDCVISLDQRVTDQIATRRLRILKYRGSAHGANEYPFLIDEQGFVVLPITSVTLTHEAPTDHVSTGVAKLDIMLGGKGIIRSSAVMLSGGTGTGKSSLAAHLSTRPADAASAASTSHSKSRLLRSPET
jgi:circadian clock protein KaiC